MRVSTSGFTYESLLGCNFARWGIERKKKKIPTTYLSWRNLLIHIHYRHVDWFVDVFIILEICELCSYYYLLRIIRRWLSRRAFHLRHIAVSWRLKLSRHSKVLQSGCHSIYNSRRLALHTSVLVYQLQKFVECITATCFHWQKLKNAYRPLQGFSFDLKQHWHSTMHYTCTLVSDFDTNLHATLCAVQLCLD